MHQGTILEGREEHAYLRQHIKGSLFNDTGRSPLDLLFLDLCSRICKPSIWDSLTIRGYIELWYPSMEEND